MRDDAERLDDVIQAIAKIEAHLRRGSLDDDLVFDAVRMRLLEIGEAVKDIGEDVLAAEPDIPWRGIAGMRDRLAHQYFATDTEIVKAAAENQLSALLEAVSRLRASLEDEA